MKALLPILLLAAAGLSTAHASDGVEAQLGTARVTKQADVLTLSTGRITRTFNWNKGNLISTAVIDERDGSVIRLAADKPDISGGLDGGGSVDGALAHKIVADDGITPAHLEVTVAAKFADVELRRTCTLFPDSPAIRCAVAWRGKVPVITRLQSGDNQMIETTERAPKLAGPNADRLAVTSAHWKAEAVRFLASTDHNDNLVHHQKVLLYREPQLLTASILHLSRRSDGKGLFILKEAPLGADQIAWPGADFALRTGEVQALASGLEPGWQDAEGWSEAYPITVGLGGKSAQDLGTALRAHLETIRKPDAARDSMIMANTWGDRSRDARMSAAFIENEIDRAAEMGVTALQLDDGWQAGLSKNSANRAGSKWEDWSAADWLPHPERFPAGLSPLVEKAKAKDVEIGLWFNPSQVDDFANWRRDADIIIGYWQSLGIRHFKIDGVNVPNRKAEANLRSFFEHVAVASKGAVLFNLDVTAGRRSGYFSMNRYGNIFLENRYTDWGNYYPHRTLRNLWMLSAYVPPQWLQAEFLNVARNPQNYAADDRLSPANVGIDYAFATTMPAQPLAWMELSGLAASERSVALSLKQYRTFQQKLHSQRIFPVGAEPDGSANTGFQSVAGDGNSGYLLLYREPLATGHRLHGTLFTAGDKVELRPIMGAGKTLTVAVDDNGAIQMPSIKNGDFGVFEYRVTRNSRR
jgi:alpha-galactosidase